MAKKKSSAKSKVTELETTVVVAEEANATTTATMVTAAATESTNDPASTDPATATAEDELELLQVDLGDMIKLKQVLDEAVAASLLDQPTNPQAAADEADTSTSSPLLLSSSSSSSSFFLLEEDTAWDNFKLCLMALACAFAMMAQFAPIPFPQSRPVLGICGTAYFVLSGILQLITTFVDQDTILILKPIRLPPPEADVTAPSEKMASSSSNSGGGINKNSKKSTSGGGGSKAAAVTTTSTSMTRPRNPDLEQYGIRVRTNLPRFSEFYSVILQVQVKPASNGGKKSQPKQVEQRWSVGQFFDKEGYFDEIGLQQEIDTLFHRLEQGDYDDNDVPPSSASAGSIQEKKRQ